jgi:hypothetical protein
MDSAQMSKVPGDPFAVVPIEVIAVMRTIKPEHIAELNYADCFNSSVGKNHSNNALFVALKPGIGFEPGRGSYVIEEKQTPRANTYASALPAFRNRLLGVYDSETGDPVSGATVTDVATGTSALTTATGTVTLVFLPEGTSSVRVSKSGYTDLTFDVSISAENTLPITLVLQKK